MTTAAHPDRAPSRQAVATSEQVPEGGRLVVDVAATTIGIFRFRQRLYAYENVCAHQGGPVCQGRLVNRVVEVLDADQNSTGMRFDGDTLHVVCPWHGAEYDVTTGAHPAQPALRLRSFAVSEEGGTIHVSL
jgi:nitrite reductase/ring-hydroxylating ferredoxin subunit